MSNQIIFTVDELYQFSKTLPLTIIELSKFIEDKTNQQYVIVQKDSVVMNNEYLTLNLKDFIKTNPDANLFTLASWINLYADQRFAFVEKKMIEDAVYALTHHIVTASEANDTFKQRWRETLKALGI